MTRATRPRTRRGELDAGQQLLSRAAHWHADRGMAVFPLVPGRKTPAVEDWEHAATTDHLSIAQIWRRAPYNIGVAAGRSGLVVVDLDRPKGAGDTAPEPWHSRGAASGGDVLALLAADAGQELPATYTVATASGGSHLYFRQPDGIRLGNTAGRLGWKIDTRGHGGYVVAAGSVTFAGWYATTSLTAPQPLPAWITGALTRSPDQPTAARTATQQLKDASAYTLAAVSGELDKLLAATEGHRNDTLNRAAFALGQLVGADLLDQSTARDELLSAAGRLGLDRSEASRTISSGLTAGARHPRRTVTLRQ
ncbi:Bifunctional DNA primase/polymerase [Kribbella flavida DSM 17836]|uniref:Bifunctional DNA primase/polymerase n=1 Tax=Kribbella flavida (strain DSM 17836 / JCM 10339 / NBRC 14399) TaxID=479435 RepID=D2PTG3_KRIFD|nr:bifunctional DNA primase/polymerase [Kribbella flavida]ADB31276.1 Bifunctional DNA primase/polymerase [Kribbella flavida DSM 17836]